MDASDVELLERQTGYQGVFRLERWRLRHRRFDGGWTRPLVREVFIRGRAAGVLPYDPDRDEVVLIEQFRCGAYAAGRPPWVIEIVAGIIEEGEEPEAVARRETLEETGLTATALEKIAEFMPSPGAMMETTILYCGRIDAARAAGFHGLAEEGEDIRLIRLPAAAALALLEAGRADTAITVVALQWLALHREALRARWCPAAGVAGT